MIGITTDDLGWPFHASRAISAVAELLVYICCVVQINTVSLMLVAANTIFACRIIHIDYRNSTNFSMTFLGKILCTKFMATSSLLKPWTSRHISYTLSSAVHEDYQVLSICTVHRLHAACFGTIDSSNGLRDRLLKILL